MVDMWSRLTISIIVERKKPKEVIDVIMGRWIGYFGTMKAVLNDNGGEFTAQEVREVKGILNVEDLTTGAESPWQNGLCEKNHAIVDTMLERMTEDYPETDEQVLLGWANMAKNSMQMVYGYSSNQLVFGTNPNLPNIMSDGLPAMDGKTSSEVFAKHLNALHAARKAFIESESCERIRKALKKKVCTNNTIFHKGDRVYYKRERDGSWRGPAHVIFQDGKIIFVRHGSVYVRVSANRIVRKGEEFQENNDEVDSSTTPEIVPAVNNSNVVVAADDTSHDENIESIVSDSEPDVDEILEENVREMLLDSEPEVDENLDENVPETLLDSNDLEMLIDQNVPVDPDVSTVITEDGRRKGKATETEEVFDKRPRTAESSSIQAKPKVVNPKSKGKKINLKKNDLIDIQMEDGEWLKATVSDRSKVSGSFYNYFNIRGEDGLDRNVDLERLRFREICEEVNMVLIPQERNKDDYCKAAKQVELKKLEDFDVFKLVDDAGQYRISCKWILWVKGDEVRARLCARGFEETEDIPSDSPTVDKPNIRVLLLIAASYGWVIESSDVKSAFLQGRALDRTVTLTPPREANVEKGKLWELKVALYGLDDASLQFFFKCKDILLKLKCKQSSYDPAFFYKHDSDGKLEGCIALHVDDFLHAGTEKFRQEVTLKLSEIFKMGKTDRKSFVYTGFELEQTQEGIKVSQNEFARAKIEVFDVKPDRAKGPDDDLSAEEVSIIRKAAGKIGWLARGTRPDLVFPQVEMSTKHGRSKVRDLIQALKLLRKVKDSESFFLIKGLGPVKDWKIEVSTDASLSNLNDGVDSTGAHVILIKNSKGDCAPMVWNANKIKRIVGSTLEAECLALVDGAKEAVYLREVIEEIFDLKDKTIPVEALVDNKGTIDAVHSTAPVADRRLRRDVGIVKQMLNTKEISSVSWCSGKDQLADGMTKRTASCFELKDVFQTGRRK